MNVALCCIGKLENRYIREFVEYYKNLGVDKIYLFDNNDEDGEEFEDVIEDYVDSEFVDLIDYRGKKVCQLEAYQACYNKFNKRYDWMMFFDIDEFLTFKEDGVDVKTFLSMDKFNGYDMIHVNWMVYGDNDLIHYEPRNVVDRFTEPTMPLDFESDYDMPENNHVKSIIRGGLPIKKVKWNVTPHTPNGELKCCNCDGMPCNASSPFNDYTFESAWLRHYQTKTLEEWFDIKVGRGFADGNSGHLKGYDAVEAFFRRNKMTDRKQQWLDERFKIDARVILSMTTIPMRTERLEIALSSILEQSYHFDKLVINIDDNLTDEQYNYYESLKKKDPRIEINKAEAKWRSCNKLLPTLKLYPEDIIITVDDDVKYPKDTVKVMIDMWNKHKDCIISHEINPIVIDKEFKKISYINSFDIKFLQKQWGKYLSNCCLFPPHVFDGTDLYDYDKMMKCTQGTHDELWFWVNSTVNGVMVIGLNYVKSFHQHAVKEYEKGEYALTTVNESNDKIEEYMKVINKLYGKKILKNIKDNLPQFTITNDNIYGFFFLFPFIEQLYSYGFETYSDELDESWRQHLHMCFANGQFMF